MPVLECGLASFVILAAAVAMYVLFRDPLPLRRPDEPRVPASGDHEPEHSGAFLTRIAARRSTRAAAATLAAAAFGVLEDATHQLVINLQLHPALRAIADSCIVALSGAAVVWLILTAVSRRHAALATQKTSVTELNGDLREALETIVLASYTAPPADRQAVIRCVEKIEKTLPRLHPHPQDAIVARNAAARQNLVSHAESVNTR